MEVGAVSVMLYCFRERELLLNINEMIAGFRMFPSYMRVGGLREDLPRGFHEAVRAFLDRMPPKLDEYEDLLTKNEIYTKRTQGVGLISTRAVLRLRAGRADRARGGRRPTTCARRSRTPATRRSSSTCRRAPRARRLRRATWCASREMRESMKICRQALERITPTGVFQVDDPQRHAAAEGQGLHRDGSADSALPDLLAGLHRAGGRGVRAGRGAARRARLLHRVGRHEPAVARASRGRRRCWPARRWSR